MASNFCRDGANALLHALSPACRSFLSTRMMTKPIRSGEVLYEAEAPLQNFIFPQGGLVSVQARINDQDYREVITVGRDGMVGALGLLELQFSQGRAVAVASGAASWLPVTIIEEALDRFPGERRLFARSTAKAIARLMQSVACTGSHSAGQRIGTWLVRAFEIAGTHQIDITQQTLGSLLGLRQATVSEVCGTLQKTGAISQWRGGISLADRNALVANACECWHLGEIGSFAADAGSH